MNDFIGDVHITTLMPNGNGANTAWTGVYTDVNENPPNGDTSYAATSSTGYVETYDFENFAAPTDYIIKAVVSNIFAKKDNAGEVEIQSYYRATDDDEASSGNSFSLSDSYIVYQEIYELNPDDDAAWADGDIDGAEFGVIYIS